MNLDDFIPRPGKRVKLKRDFDPGFTGDIDKEDGKKRLQDDIASMIDFQARFYADHRHALLLVFQAMDAAGKDGTIKHVMSGLNPQGCRVTSFKTPTSHELSHDFLWRATVALPEKGEIGIFNRSYYEDVLVTRVHPDLLNVSPKGLWKKRFEQINNFEAYLTENGTHVLKFFLNVSKDEQKKRFLSRIEQPEKNWKISPADTAERTHWDAYQEAYEDMLEHTSTEAAPWYIIPADHKWFTHLAVAAIVVKKLKEIDPSYPAVSDEQRKRLLEIKAALEAE